MSHPAGAVCERKDDGVRIFGNFIESQKPGQGKDEETLRCRLRCDLGNNIIRGLLWLSFYACCTILLSRAMDTPPEQLRCVMEETYQLFEKIFVAVFVNLFSRSALWVFIASVILILLGFVILGRYLRNRLMELRQEIDAIRLERESHAADPSSDSNRCRSPAPYH